MYFWCLGHFVAVSSLIQLLISAEKRKKGVKCEVNETKSKQLNILVSIMAILRLSIMAVLRHFASHNTSGLRQVVYVRV